MSKGKRQIWIEFGGDPSNDKEVYKRYSATVPFEPSSYAEEVVHTIEFKAYEELQKENERLRAALQVYAALPDSVTASPFKDGSHQMPVNVYAKEALAKGEGE